MKKQMTSLALVLAIAGGAVPNIAQNGAPLGMQSAHAQSGITVLLNGRVLNLGAAGATQQSGRVLVPLRGVFEALGATVDFDNATQTVFATRDTLQMQLRIGSTQANVNGQVRTLDVPAKTLFGRTLVPLRFVSEALGASVSWNEAQSTVYITTTNATTPTNPPVTPPVNPPVEPPVASTRQTITGSVVRLGTSGSDFVLGLPDGQTFTVRTTQPLPASLSAADQVRVVGVRGTEFAADTLEITSDVTARRGRGEVIAVRNRILSVRVASGEVLAVQVRQGNRMFAVGDNVRFDGFDDGALIRYSLVYPIAGGNDVPTDVTPPTSTGTNVDFAGVVETVDAARNQLRVRGDNGQLYTVNYAGADTVERYQRVRVQGSFANGATTARTITVVQ